MLGLRTRRTIQAEEVWAGKRDMGVRSMEVRVETAQREHIESKTEERVSIVIVVCEVGTGLGSRMSLRRVHVFIHTSIHVC